MKPAFLSLTSLLATVRDIVVNFPEPLCHWPDHLPWELINSPLVWIPLRAEWQSAMAWQRHLRKSQASCSMPAALLLPRQLGTLHPSLWAAWGPADDSQEAAGIQVYFSSMRSKTSWWYLISPEKRNIPIRIPHESVGMFLFSAGGAPSWWQTSVPILQVDAKNPKKKQN